MTLEAKPQEIYDTLYLHPDTTNFNDNSITIVGDITNIAVRFTVDSSWDNYQIEKIIFTQPNGVDTNGYSYLFLSLGEMPEDTIIYYKQIFWNNPPFPVNNELLIETPIIISKHKSFYLSGGFFFVLSISNYLEYGIPGEYAFWYSQYNWVEYVPVYFNLKVIVKKNLTNVDESPLKPNNFLLEQNYPNPFNSQTKIIYNAPENGNAELEIYDILGNKMYSLSTSSTQIGYNEFTLNAENFVSGVYLYKVTINKKFSSMKKMVVLK
jgi:hypothetical protein